MSSKGSLGNVYLFHMYLVVARTEIQFSEELGTTQFIQEVVNDRNGEFVFDGKFFEGTEVRTHSPRTLFLQDHDHRRRVGARTRADNTCIKELERMTWRSCVTEGVSVAWMAWSWEIIPE